MVNTASRICAWLMKLQIWRDTRDSSFEANIVPTDCKGHTNPRYHSQDYLLQKNLVRTMTDLQPRVGTAQHTETFVLFMSKGDRNDA